MKAEEIKLAFEANIKLALVDEIQSKLSQAQSANTKGADLVKQANSNFNQALGLANSAFLSAKDGEDKAKFLGLDASKLTALKKDADNYMKLASGNVKKYS